MQELLVQLSLVFIHGTSSSLESVSELIVFNKRMFELVPEMALPNLGSQSITGTVSRAGAEACSISGDDGARAHSGVGTSFGVGIQDEPLWTWSQRTAQVLDDGHEGLPSILAVLSLLHLQHVVVRSLQCLLTSYQILFGAGKRERPAENGFYGLWF